MLLVACIQSLPVERSRWTAALLPWEALPVRCCAHLAGRVLVFMNDAGSQPWPPRLWFGARHRNPAHNIQPLPHLTPAAVRHRPVYPVTLRDAGPGGEVRLTTAWALYGAVRPPLDGAGACWQMSKPVDRLWIRALLPGVQPADIDRVGVRAADLVPRYPDG